MAFVPGAHGCRVLNIGKMIKNFANACLMIVHFKYEHLAVAGINHFCYVPCALLKTTNYCANTSVVPSSLLRIHLECEVLRMRLTIIRLVSLCVLMQCGFTLSQFTTTPSYTPSSTPTSSATPSSSQSPTSTPSARPVCNAPQIYDPGYFSMTDATGRTNNDLGNYDQCMGTGVSQYCIMTGKRQYAASN
jgi:hypothetical protein